MKEFSMAQMNKEAKQAKKEIKEIIREIELRNTNNKISAFEELARCLIGHNRQEFSPNGIWKLFDFNYKCVCGTLSLRKSSTGSISIKLHNECELYSPDGNLIKQNYKW